VVMECKTPGVLGRGISWYPLTRGYLESGINPFGDLPRKSLRTRDWDIRSLGSRWARDLISWDHGALPVDD